MNAKQRTIAIICALLLPLGTLLFMEQMHYADKIKSVFFGDIQNLGSFKLYFGDDYWKLTKSLMGIIAVSFIAYIMFYVFFFEILALLYFLFSSKWRKPKVFISYKHSAPEAIVNTTKIALEIKKVLEQKGFPVLMHEFTDKLHHDNINDEIKKKQKKSNALIAIPDPYLPSYVDSEILVAFNADKPVYIIKHTADQRLPNTANSGHTVFLLAKLKKLKYKPLTEILQYTHNMWHSRFYILSTPVISFMMPFALFEEGSGHFFKSTIAFALFALGAAYFGMPIITLLWIIKITATVLGILGTYLGIQAIFKNHNFQKVLKQSMVNAGNTFEAFQKIGFDKEVLAAIDKVGLKQS